MERAFIGLGSNLGDRLGFLRAAVGGLARIPKTSIQRVSSVYETEPVGRKDQPFFLNMVAELQTEIDAYRLHAECQAIEKRIGRTPSERWGPREIDLDILYVGEQCLAQGDLIIPHPEVANRKFVLQPMAELAPGFIDPLRKQSIRELLEASKDTSAVTLTQYCVFPYNVEV